MARYKTQIHSVRFGDLKITFGGGLTDELIDTKILTASLVMDDNYQFIDQDLSTQISVTFSNESNWTSAIISYIIANKVAIQIDSTEEFFGIVDRESIVRDFKERTISFTIVSPDFADTTYSGATATKITFETYLDDLLGQYGLSDLLETVGDCKYTLADGTDVYIHDGDAGVGDQYLQITSTQLKQKARFKEVLNALMIDISYIVIKQFMIRRDRGGASIETIDSFKEAHKIQEYNVHRDYHEAYRVKIMNKHSSAENTFYEACSNELITDAKNHLNNWLSTATIDTADWTLESVSFGLIPTLKDGYNYFSDLNGMRVRFPTSVADGTNDIIFKLGSTKYGSVSQGDILFVNLELNDVYAMDIYFRLTSSTEIKLNRPNNYDGNGAANYSFEYIVDGDPTSDSIEIRLSANVDFMVADLEGFRVTAATYSGSTLTVTTQGDPADLSISAGSQMTLHNITNYSGYTMPNVASVTANTISFTVGLSQPTPVLEEDAGVFFRDAMFKHNTTAIANISIGKKEAKTKEINLTEGEDVTKAVFYGTDSASTADDVNLNYAMMDRVIETAEAVIGDKTDKFRKRVTYSSKVDILGYTRLMPFDKLTDGTDNYKQLSHKLDLISGRVKIDARKI